MRIKNFFQLLITVLFLGSCGSSYTVVRSDERQKSNLPLNTEGDYVERIEFITEEYNFEEAKIIAYRLASKLKINPPVFD